jgi:hypothetical protein
LNYPEGPAFNYGRKVKKTANFQEKQAVLVVAGAGFEPTTFGL